MLSVNEPGSEVWLSPARNPDRKLKFTWEMIRIGRSLVGINTQHPNTLLAEAIECSKVPELKGYGDLRREVKYGKNSRIDILLEDPKKGLFYIEVKNVTMLSCFDRDRADFPDSVTERGRKHLEVLTRLSESGKRAILFLLLGRTDCNKVGFAQEIDPVYCEALRVAVAAGVEVISHRVRVRSGNLTLGESVPIKLPGRVETS